MVVLAWVPGLCLAQGTADRTVDEWVERIPQATTSQRRDAVRALLALGPDAVPGLIRALSRPDLPTLEIVVEVLKDMGDIRAVGPYLSLIDRLGESEADAENPGANLLNMTVEALIHLGTGAVDPLIKAFRLHSRSVGPAEAKKEALKRQAVFRALSALPDDRATAVFLSALEDGNPEIRRLAVDALGKLASSRAVDPLIRLVGASYEAGEVMAAVDALGRIRNRKAVPALLLALKSRLEGVRIKAAWSLAVIGDNRAVAGLLRALRSGLPGPERRAFVSALCKFNHPSVSRALKDLLSDKDPDVRFRALETLVSRGEQALLPDLLAVLASGKDPLVLRIQAAQVLGRLGPPGAAAALLGVASRADEDSRLLSAVIEMLGKLREKGAVDVLTKRLGHPLWPVREKAAEALGRIGDIKALKPLLALLEDSRREVRVQGEIALARLADGAVPRLLNLLKTGSESARIHGAGALGRVGSDSAVQGLLEAQSGAQGAFQRQLAVVLADLGRRGNGSRLAKALDDRDPSIRIRAACALARTRYVQAVPALLEMLETPSHEEQSEALIWSAVFALGELGDRAAFGGLIRALAHRSPSVGCTAAVALGRLGDGKALEFLSLRTGRGTLGRRTARALGMALLGRGQALRDLMGNELHDIYWHLKTPSPGPRRELGAIPAPVLAVLTGAADPAVRRVSAVLLGVLHPGESFSRILPLLKDSRVSVRVCAAEVLVKGKDPRCLGPLTDLLGDLHEDARKSAAYALGRLGDPKAWQALAGALKDRNRDVRLYAAEGLGRTGAREGVEALIEALGDPSLSVRGAARHALRMLLHRDLGWDVQAWRAAAGEKK